MSIVQYVLGCRTLSSPPLNEKYINFKLIIISLLVFKQEGQTTMSSQMKEISQRLYRSCNSQNECHTMSAGFSRSDCLTGGTLLSRAQTRCEKHHQHFTNQVH